MLHDPKWKERDYILVRGRISDEFIERVNYKVNSLLILNDFPNLSIDFLLRSILSRLMFLKNIKKYDEIYGNIYDLRFRKTKARLIQLDDGLMTKKIIAGDYENKVKNMKVKNNPIFRYLFNLNYVADIQSFLFIVPESYKEICGALDCNFINISKKINNLADIEYKEICSVYGFFPRKLNGKSILLLQSFFEDGLVSSLDYEINMYREVLKSEGIFESDVYIKPHPKSKIDYTQYFIESEFIPKDFPYELLVRESNNNRFKKVLTINSSGVEEFATISDEVITFGTSKFKELDFSPMIRI